MSNKLKDVALNEATGALAYARHYYGSMVFPESVKNLLGRLEKIRLAALSEEVIVEPTQNHPDCICRGFFQPRHCPVHGGKK